MFQILSEKCPKVELPVISVGDFAKNAGEVLPVNDPHFEARVLQVPNGLLISGMGLFPAYTAREGTLFRFPVPTKEKSRFIQLKIISRAFSGK